MDPRFNRGARRVRDRLSLIDKLPLATQQIVGGVNRHFLTTLPAIESQIRSELGLPAVFDRHTSSTEIAQYVELFQSALPDPNAPDAADRTETLQDAFKHII